jgi:Ala-tRNA(Pro) deacylase
MENNQLSPKELIENENKVYRTLDGLGVYYDVIEHEPLYTAEELVAIKDIAKGTHCKNLFLRNSKGSEYYLIVVRDDKQVDLKLLKDKIGSTRLSFASPGRLLNVLKLTPGSVNPFSLMNDEEHKVKLFVDKDILNGENLNFHPNINTKMVNLPLDGFEKFLGSLENYRENIEV